MFMGMRNLIKFNKSRCKVLLLGQGSPRCEYRLGQEVTEDSPAEEDWDKKRSVSQPCVLTGITECRAASKQEWAAGQGM